MKGRGRKGAEKRGNEGKPPNSHNYLAMLVRLTRIVRLVTHDCIGDVIKIDTLYHCEQCSRQRQYECEGGMRQGDLPF